MLSSCVSRRKRKFGLISIEVSPGFPGGSGGKDPICQCKRHKTRGFDPWVRKIPWRRAWQPTPVFLPGESHGERSLVGCSPCGRKELDMTKATEHTRMHTKAFVTQGNASL